MQKHNTTKWGDKENRRLDIMQAARDELEKTGYSGLNVRNVAKRAQISPGLLYSYFANKEELFAVLYAERLVEFNQHMQLICQQADDIEQLLLELLQAYLPVYQTFGREFNLFSLLRNPQQFSEEISQQLSQTAIELMSTLFSHFNRLAQQANLEIAHVPQSQLVLPMFWIVLNGLAEHFSGERQTLYGHGMDTMTRFIATTLMAGLQQLATSPANS